MTRENRVNFIFLALFLALSLPGAVILFRKKLDPTAARMDQPDPVVHRLPYMAPLPAPPDIQWVVPPRTRNWIERLSRERVGGDRVLSSSENALEWEPVVSSDHRVQVIGASESKAQTEVDAVVWEASLKLETTLDGTAGRILTEPVTVPEEVRRELMNFGLIRPPATVQWMRASFPLQPPAGQLLILDLTYPPGTEPASSRLSFRLPLQSPAKTSHG